VIPITGPSGEGCLRPCTDAAGSATFGAMSEPPRPRIAITWCRQCRWLLRAAWLAQELLSTFADEPGEVALVPGAGGVFRIDCDGELVWERRRDGGFPDAATLKQRVRARLAPGRDLGHVDHGAG
jgi:selenoprotein W-related protein